MKRIGVLTFHNAINYGAVLQTYALQQTLKSMGGLPCVIDYRSPSIQKAERYICIDSFKKFLKSLFNLRQASIKKKKFNNFISDYIDISNRYEKEDLYKIENLFDKFIVGSDQVWNPYITDYDDTYLLSFVNDSNKRNSYAASFGLSQLPMNWCDKCMKELARFHVLSTRESTGKELITRKIKTDVSVDLDPVFLRTADEWRSLVKNKKGKYIFVYMPWEETLTFAKKVSDETGMPIIQCGWKSVLNPRKNVGAIESTLGPDEFLSLLHNSEYVVTGSFHATAFSIIFHKKFFVEIPSKVGSRIQNLLEMFSLQDRRIGSDCNNDINWDMVDGLLAEYQSASKERLRNIIEK